MKVPIAELRDLTRKAVLRTGYTPEETKIIEEVLLFAQLRDSNQGIVKLIGKSIPKDPAAGEIRVVRETKLSALLDGAGNMGMIVMERAKELALAKAREHGFGIAGSHGTNTSTGAIGYWAGAIAREGFLGFVFTSPLKVVAPHGSSQAVLGTNPVSIGVPSEGDPIVLDMSTAAIAFYGLIEAKTAGRTLDAGLTYDREGNETTDPASALKGAIRAFGGHKGSGLAVMIEALAGVLVGATDSWGNLVFVIDPSLLADRETFRKNVAGLAGRIKSARKASGAKEVLLPGERGDRLSRERLKSGEIEIEDNLYRELTKVANG